MELSTQYNIGDVVWISQPPEVSGPYTIGMVRVEVKDSPGMPGETVFDNYKAQTGRIEEYMCVETGIGAGYVYSVERVHSTRTAAEDANHAAPA